MVAKHQQLASGHPFRGGKWWYTGCRVTINHPLGSKHHWGVYRIGMSGMCLCFNY